jgi:predicted nucleotide-binding protein (sugar kinase/HSP70/actin superfamily)
MTIENNVNIKALDIVACPLLIFGLYAVINFDTPMKVDHRYMTLEQSKHNVNTHHSASKDYTKTMANEKTYLDTNPLVHTLAR